MSVDLSYETLILALVAASTLALLVGGVVSISLLRASASQHKDARAVLSMTREYYEERIASLNERLTATQERWEEVNHLLLSGQNMQSGALQAFDPKSIPIFSDLRLETDSLAIIPDLVFVLTPVLRDEERTYLAIESACRAVGLRAFRADAESTPGEILRQIVRYIAQSRIVIANVGNRNPNVYYELGIAHALGKQTILVSKTIEEVSFDISANRVVTFGSMGELSVRLQHSLRSAMAGEAYLAAKQRD